jgi:uncharacterized repeat protein (TIGR02543 family)
MKITLKKLMVLITLSLITFANMVFLIDNKTEFTVQAEETLASSYELDNVYSTYSPSTNYTIEGAIYSNRDSLLVRSISTEKVNAGVTLSFTEEILVAEDTAIVIDAMFYSNLSRSVRVELVESDSTINMMQNTEDAYLAKNNEVVTTLEILNNSFSNCLNASSGYATGDVSTAYNQLVVPLTSFGYEIGETVSFSSINFYGPNWSTAIYSNYLLMAVNTSSDFSVLEQFTTENIWTAGIDAYTEYGSVTNNLDIQILNAGQLLMEPSINGSGNAILQQMIFKFPDELINESGYVETANLKGLTIEYLNDTDITFNGHFKLFSTSGVQIADSNYMNLKTHKVTMDGTEADSNAKYFYSNTNTVGFADSFIRYNFESTDTVVAESTESFHSADGNLPAEISPYLSFSYDNSTTLSIDGVYLGTIRVLTNDISVYENTFSSSEIVTVSNAKGYLGNEVNFKAETNSRLIDRALLNNQEITTEELSALTSTEGLTVVMTGDMNLQVIFDDELPLAITTIVPSNGTIELSNASVVSGYKVRAICVPDTGYEFAWLKANNIDVTADVIDGIYITTVTEEIEFEAGFTVASDYYLESGATSSLYNSFPGVIWAEFDAVNVQTTYDFRDSLAIENIGVTLTGIDETVTSEDYLVIDIHNMVNMWRTFYINIDGTTNSADGTYYLANRYNEILTKTGMGIITESSSSSNTTNATFSVVKTEGFFGKIIIPLSNFENITSINNITIETQVKDKSYARFNVGDVYVTNQFDSATGHTSMSEDIIWSPEETNWSSIDSSAEFSNVSFMNEGEISLQTVDTNEYGYDALYVSLPQNMINNNGYVDLEALGIKGIAVDVKNYNMLQHSMAIRVAGSDNTSLTDTSLTLWQTSISNHPASVIYPSGLVKSRNSAFIPYDDGGVFEGTVYIPLDSIAFTNIGAQGGFPSLIQPVIRILPGSMNDTGYSSYDFEIGNVRFITDESEFSTYQITLTQIGGTVAGDIDGISVSNNANNNVLNNTSVDFNIIPDNGYSITSVTYQMGDGPVQQAVLNNSNSFNVNITGEILVQVICDEVEYSVTYNLDGGVNSVDNPSNFTVESSKTILEAATKEGYSFLGWFAGEEQVTEIAAGSTDDVALTARWAEDTVTANFSAWLQEIDLWIKIATPTFVAGLAAAVVLIIKKKK